MRPLHLLPVVAASVVPLHTGHPHLVTDSLLGVAVGVVVVGLYVLALRWTHDGRDDGPRNREGQSNR
ncbi:hypothetical protein HZS55_20155 [Halosimplex rubrum]|uniref:Uncharacterized protein n=1 Tax=Halosimplex rubrum TaxID=869889 RepID=A0A7D5P721_9EURY|nr:hypothetical protein [Halosimplex rubrum]QLH79465.1 hypothetical protein HZS55_20155 [Halosimplex rubrum]